MKDYLSKSFYKTAAAIFCAVLWGSAFPVLKLIYKGMSVSPHDVYTQIVLAGARFFLASIMIFISLKFIMKQPIRVPGKRALPPLILLGLVQTVMQYCFFYNGMARTTGSKGAVIMSSDAFFIILFAHLIYQDDRINWKKVLCLALGFTGIVIVNWGKGGLDFEFTFVGEGLLILAAAAGAAGSIYTKRLSQTMHPFLLTAWQMLIGSVILLGFGCAGFKPERITLSAEVWILFFYSVFLSAAAFSLWGALMKYNKAGEISIFKFVTPISGAALSVIFIPGEAFSVSLLISLLLVSIGIAVVH